MKPARTGNGVGSKMLLLERRPQRAASAQSVLSGVLAAMDGAVSARSPVLFAARFQDLSAGCNAWHAAEQVPFFEVRPPEVRLSPIRFEPTAPTHRP